MRRCRPGSVGDLWPCSSSFINVGGWYPSRSLACKVVSRFSSGAPVIAFPTSIASTIRTKNLYTSDGSGTRRRRARPRQPGGPRVVLEEPGESHHLGRCRLGAGHCARLASSRLARGVDANPPVSSNRKNRKTNGWSRCRAHRFQHRNFSTGGSGLVARPGEPGRHTDGCRGPGAAGDRRVPGG
jgi:hypothetical protein